MIDITTSKEPTVIKTRQRMHKNFDIDVTINEETHNLEIDVFHTEDVDGGDTELVGIKISGFTFTVCGPQNDVGAELHNHLDAWFGNHFTELDAEDTEEDFANIFSAIWEYIESKNLH